MPGQHAPAAREPDAALEQTQLKLLQDARSRVSAELLKYKTRYTQLDEEAVALRLEIQKVCIGMMPIPRTINCVLRRAADARAVAAQMERDRGHAESADNKPSADAAGTAAGTATTAPETHAAEGPNAALAVPPEPAPATSAERSASQAPGTAAGTMDVDAPSS